MTQPAYCPVCFTTFEGDPEVCANMRCRRARAATGWPRLLGPGELLDRHYRIDRMLAVGGAGVTYQAREIDPAGEPLDPALAIKVLHTQRASGSFLQRLANEAQILQRLSNPHIVECMGFVQRRGQAPYLVTRFEPGGTLEDLVVDIGALPAWTVAGIIRQIMDALAAAHDKGVVHRDLKPANVLLRKRTARVRIPHVRVADFGIAKVGGGLADGLTRVGAFIGTPHFAAPEQFGGRDTGPAIDVFAAGALAYWLLTGRVYFSAPESGQLADYPDAILDALPARLPTELVADERGQRVGVLLEGLMRVDVSRRWSVQQAAEYLDWVLGVRPGRPSWLAQDQAGPRPEPAAPPSMRGMPEQEVDRTGPTRIRTPARRAPDRRASASTRVPRPAARAPEVLPPTDPGTTAVDTKPARASRAAAPKKAPPARRTPARRPASIGPGPRVGRDDHRRGAVPVPRKPSAAKGSHPDDPWPPKSSAGGTSIGLEDIFGTAGPTGTTDHGDREERPYEPPELSGVQVRASGEPTWSVLQPMDLPHPLPESGPDLLRVLAAVAPVDRREVSRRLLRIRPELLADAMKEYAPGGDPTWGRGVGLAVELLRREDWEPIARSLLSDPEAGVRVAGAAGLSRVGGVVTLKTLQNLLEDEEPQVRIAAVRALARCARAAGRGRSARFVLQKHLADPEQAVADAVELALVDLE